MVEWEWWNGSGGMKVEWGRKVEGGVDREGRMRAGREGRMGSGIGR